MRLDEIKRNLNKKVRFTDPRSYLENEEFILTACVVWRDKDGRLRYSAEITDMGNCRSVLRCRIEEIEAAERGRV